MKRGRRTIFGPPTLALQVDHEGRLENHAVRHLPSGGRSAALRTHEIGVRTALGAQPADVVATIGRRAAVQRAVGILVGMPLAGRLYYLIQEDPAAKGAAVVPGVGVLLLLALLACTGPLVRALRVAPDRGDEGRRMTMRFDERLRTHCRAMPLDNLLAFRSSALYFECK
jgi:hypothetical protein